MKQQGKIVALEHNRVWVDVARQTACGSCAAKSGCGTSLMARALPHSGNVIEVTVDSTAYALGDTVELSLADDKILVASALVYGVPLVGLLGGAVLGSTLFANEPSVILSAVVGAVLGGLLVSCIDKRYGAGLKARVNHCASGLDVIDLSPINDV